MTFGLLVLTWLGKLANLAGLPGFVRRADYVSQFGSASVRITPLFTVVTVNGTDIYFYRLSGRIDGIGFQQASYSGAGTPARAESADLDGDPPL